MQCTFHCQSRIIQLQQCITGSRVFLAGRKLGRNNNSLLNRSSVQLFVRWVKRKVWSGRRSCKSRSRSHPCCQCCQNSRNRHCYQNHQKHYDPYHHELGQELMTKLVMADTRSENAEMDIGRLNVRIDKVTVGIRILSACSVIMTFLWQGWLLWYKFWVLQTVAIGGQQNRNHLKSQSWNK